ncbi:MAG: hypothetical protein PHF00_12390 [Elusimicrobia bacterium]|nr:hypothetical protein [Elusimicrobiota bacterium]
MSLDTTTGLSADGPLKGILPDFELRPQQIEMARAVDGALRARTKLIVEAGTGVGKSIAYLLPGALWAVEAEAAAKDSRPRRLVVATCTKALQQQLVDKDLPIIRRLLEVQGEGLRFALLMGSENYLCLARVQYAKDGKGSLFARGEEESIDRIESWSRTAGTGLRAGMLLDNGRLQRVGPRIYPISD